MLAAGCPLKPPPNPEEIRRDAGGATAALQPESTWKAAPVDTQPVAADWLASFGDARLTALVAEAMANSPDLRIVAVKVEQAEAYVRIAQAALKPQVNLFGTGGTNSGSGDPIQMALLSVSWEPDLWGRLRYARNAAQEMHASAEADREFARQSLAASIAKSWFAAARTGAEQALADEMAASGRRLVELAEQRVRVGAGDEQEASILRAESESLEDAAAELRLARSQTLRALELLVGRYPAAELAAPAELPPPPPPMPAGLPLQMLERRPDLVAAERRVAAAFDRVGEAKAARLPRIVLGASVGAIASDILDLKDDFENPTGGIGGRLIAPIYQGGALKTQVEIRTLEQEQAVAEYALMALRALGDVEDAIAAGASLEQREAILVRAVAQNESAVAFAETRLRVGRSDRRALLERQLDLDAARRALLAVRSERLAQRVNLHLALGGSFEPPPPPPAEEEAAAATTQPGGPR